MLDFRQWGGCIAPRVRIMFSPPYPRYVGVLCTDKRHVELCLRLVSFGIPSVYSDGSVWIRLTFMVFGVSTSPYIRGIFLQGNNFLCRWRSLVSLGLHQWILGLCSTSSWISNSLFPLGGDPETASWYAHGASVDARRRKHRHPKIWNVFFFLYKDSWYLIYGLRPFRKEDCQIDIPISATVDMSSSISSMTTDFVNMIFAAWYASHLVVRPICQPS